MGRDQSGPYNGRFRVTSTLVLPISPTDGGTVTCKTGSGHNQSADARLTVLGKFAICTKSLIGSHNVRGEESTEHAMYCV